jgi:DNA-directed RNA polymerase specialized sigma24 family protein
MSAILDRLVSLETYQEYLDVLTPGQVVVLFLREVQGMNFREIGEMLDITHQAASIRLNTAAKMLVETYPELESRAKERQFRVYRRKVIHD